VKLLQHAPAFALHICTTSKPQPPAAAALSLPTHVPQVVQVDVEHLALAVGDSLLFVGKVSSMQRWLMSISTANTRQTTRIPQGQGAKRRACGSACTNPPCAAQGAATHQRAHILVHELSMIINALKVEQEAVEDACKRFGATIDLGERPDRRAGVLPYSR
jgi:hypothetical protein